MTRPKNPPYAWGTEVPADRSRGEIESTLKRFGADCFGYATESGPDGGSAIIVFRAHARHIRFRLPLPEAGNEKEHRRRWRSMAMCIKAKLESVATGIETFEESFMSHVVMPNGKTLAEHALPMIEKAYSTGKMPPLLSFDP